MLPEQRKEFMSRRYRWHQGPDDQTRERQELWRQHRYDISPEEQQ
jgi:hypothetical protein